MRKPIHIMGYKYNIDDIIAKGSELFRKRGYHNVGINDVLKECQIPKGSFYNFFESKEHFAEKVVERFATSSGVVMQKCLRESPGTSVEKIRSLYQMLIDFHVQDGLDAGCLVTNFSYEMAGINDRLAEAMNDNFMGWVEIIAETVKAGQDAGEIIDTSSPEELAEYIHSGFNGGFARMKAQKSARFLENWLEMTLEFIQR